MNHFGFPLEEDVGPAGFVVGTVAAFELPETVVHVEGAGADIFLEGVKRKAKWPAALGMVQQSCANAAPVKSGLQVEVIYV